MEENKFERRYVGSLFIKDFNEFRIAIFEKGLKIFNDGIWSFFVIENGKLCYKNSEQLEEWIEKNHE